ncbi:MAG: M1 family metallopeptidase [Saprospiraceae bacterium]|nr:M1 family metallopeptidase [Saprospiraceae bacterium]
MKRLAKSTLYLLLLVVAANLAAQTDIYDSGGPLMPEQAAYDVINYDLSLQIWPDEQRIDGKVRIDLIVVHPMYWLVLDLDTLLDVHQIYTPDGREAAFHREGGKLWIDLHHTRQPGQLVQLTVEYGGKPRPAPMAPWSGGFSWAKTPSGAHWIATTCQGEGADIWWPCKDHVSDEPRTMGLHFRVPNELVVATNGQLLKTEPHGDGTTTYHWYISNPINIYNVSFNAAPYRLIEDRMASVAGDTFPVVFYVLPEDYEKGVELFSEIKDHLRFYEELLGPYPFRADKYGVVQTPHLGMEHQSIIAYGAKFNNGSMTGGIDWGFDALHHHELAHEWWGNLATNSDWRDMWLHEGFGSYMQPLYAERLKGREVYKSYMRNMRRFSNTLAIAPRESMTSKEIYRAPIYVKGAWVLHTLRYLMGDEAFFKALRRMAYPDPSMEVQTDGGQTRFVTTDDFLTICEEASGQSLDWLFEVYLRQPALPKLFSLVDDNKLYLHWQAPNNLPFPMPVEVEMGKEIKRYAIPPEGLVLTFEKGVKPVVDPEGWLLYEIGRK